MAKNKKVRLGLLGCGRIAQYAHLPAARKSDAIELCALCDRDPELLSKIASQYQIANSYSDHKDFLMHADAEAVLLTTPDESHVSLALDCLAAGKHLLIEKPITTDSQQARQLLQAVNKFPKLKVLIGNMKRHDPGIEFAAQFVREKMGQPLSISGWYCDTDLRPQMEQNLLLPIISPSLTSRNTANPKADVENYRLFTHGVHLANTLQFLSGPIRRILAAKAQAFGSYSWHALVEFQSAAVGHLELTVKTRCDWSEGFVAHGEFGSVSGRIFFPFLRQAADVQAFDIRTGLVQTPIAAEGDAYKRQLDSFARSITDDAPLACTVSEGIRDLQVLEALKRSLDSQSWESI